ILCFSVAFSSLFFYYSTATSHTYTLSLHDALPILTTAHTCVGSRIFRLPIFSRESWLGSGVPGYLILLWGELIAPFFISLGELIWHRVLHFVTRIGCGAGRICFNVALPFARAAFSPFFVTTFKSR